MKIRTSMVTQAAVIAAAYVVLTLPFAQFAFGGPIQFRLSEALTVLAALTSAAVPGLFIGCLLANIFNPQALGIIDIVFGSLASLLSAWLTWQLHSHMRGKRYSLLKTFLVISPSVWVNALVVGLYLPFILPGQAISPLIIGGFIGSIFVSQAVVVYLIGLPFLLALRKALRGKSIITDL